MFRRMPECSDGSSAAAMWKTALDAPRRASIYHTFLAAQIAPRVIQRNSSNE
jgi:hypothetical protein